MALIPVDFDYQSSLPAESCARYEEKLNAIGIDSPYQTPADKWSTDPTDWPPLTYWEIFHYLI